MKSPQFQQIFTIINFFIYFIFANNSFAISLEESLKISKENNRNVKYFDYKAKVAKSEKLQAVSEFLPNISLNANYGHKKNRTSGDSQNISNNERFEEIKAEQSLFNGFGSVLRYKESDYKFKSSKALKEEKAQEIALKTAESYCDLYLYLENRKYYLENKEMAQKMLNLAKKMKKARILNNSDFIELNYEMIEAKKAYENLNINLRMAKIELENLLGSKISDKLEEPKVQFEQFDKNNLLNFAFSNNQNVKSSQYNYLSAKYSHNASKTELSPKVSVIASASKQRNVVFLNQEDLDVRSIYFNVSVPIFQKGAEYSNISAKRYERKAAKEQYEIIKEDIEKEILQSLNDYEFYQEIYESDKDLEKLALNNLKAIARRSKSKIGNRLEYFKSAIEYNNYRAKTLESKINLIKSYFKIKYLKSEL